MRKISIVLLFFLLCLNAYAEPRKPIEILADSIEWNKQLGQAIATGNAKAIQDQTTIKRRGKKMLSNQRRKFYSILKFPGFHF